MKLRDYQADAVSKIQASFASGRQAPCLVLPTGSGKTLAALAYLQAHEPRAKILWMAPRVALIDQTWRQARRLGGFEERLTVTTVQALLGDSSLPSVDLCIVDEAHFFFGTAEWQRVARLFPKRLALTATPTRADGTALRELCDDLLIGASRSWLVTRGFLPPAVTYSPPKRRKTEAWGPLDAYRKFSPGEKCLIFCQTVQHAHDVRDRFLQAGLRAGSTTIESGSDLQLHYAGFLDVLTNVYMVSVGYDDPLVTTVILARPMGTCTSYIQACGRARGALLAQGERVKIIDLYGACHEWGLFDEEREYSLEGSPYRLRDPSKYTLEICESCGGTYRPNPVTGQACLICNAPVREPFKTPKEKRRDQLLAKYSVDSESTRREFLWMMVAVMRKKNLPVWVPVYRYKKRYGQRPPVEWLEQVGLRERRF